MNERESASFSKRTGKKTGVSGQRNIGRPKLRWRDYIGILSDM